MFFSGISDESGQPIATQVRAHKDLGWKHLELRMVDGVNITQLNDSAFDDVRRAVLEANMTVSCFGSAIANWARPITTEFQVDLDDLNRAIPRMRALSTPYIRVMSYPNHTEEPLPESAWRKESIRRMREMATIAEGEGIVLVHENCSGWGGLSAENSNILLGEVGSPALKVVFDTGNPVTYGQDTWEYYKAVRKDIVYVHIKDAVREKGVDHYVVCGEGEGYVPEVVGDLLATGYDGGFSIEPHLAAIIHTGQQASSDEQLYDSYVNYGRKLMDIVQRAQAHA
jgi:sugar phosphate isomerase/epimerase